MGFLDTTIPSGLNTPKNIGIVTQAVTQWSRIIAWTWSDDYLAFKGEPQEEEEKQLKALVIGVLTQQALYSGAFSSYGNSASRQLANTLSDYINNLMKSENDKIDGTIFNPELPVPKLTLNDLIMKITNEPFITSTDEGKLFIDLIYHQVLTNTFVGNLVSKPEEPNTNKEYISYLAYPPRPALCGVTVTKETLENWASDKVPGDSYLPPSPYIPIAGS